uniref:Hflx-type G domain-containing protein n=1 Tax=Neospora caninum (strain Liverpool) TaxID=572307 RepID=A0A0F7UFN1_NEOCL|nr:TPA: hypothetical protein BN1204_029330 [Neospora caninum Liverpool]
MTPRVNLFPRARKRGGSSGPFSLPSSPFCASSRRSLLQPCSSPSSCFFSAYAFSSPSLGRPASASSAPAFWFRSSSFSFPSSSPPCSPSPPSLLPSCALAFLSFPLPSSLSASSSPLSYTRRTPPTRSTGGLRYRVRLLGTATGRETGDSDGAAKPRSAAPEEENEGQSREKPEVLLLHVLFRGGPRGHLKGMRRKTKEEILWEVREAIGLARAAHWQVVPGPGTVEDGERPSWQRSLWEDPEEETACAAELPGGLAVDSEPAEAPRVVRSTRRIRAEGSAEATAARPASDSLAEYPIAEGARTEKGQKKRRNTADEYELALAESCVVVVRYENPQFLFGKGKLQEIVSFFSRRPTPFVFINCSSAFTSIPLPESLAEVYTRNRAMLSSSSSDRAGVFSRSHKTEECRVSPVFGAAGAFQESSRRIPSPGERESSSAPSASPLFGQYGYYSKNRSVAGRLMMSCSNDKTSAGLRPTQLEYLQQAFEASLAGAAATFEERRRSERAEGPVASSYARDHTWVSTLAGTDTESSEEDEEQDENAEWDEEEDAETGSGEDDDAEDLEAENERIFAWLRRKEKVQVVDRQRVILEIFTTQARNKKAMLQVALARVAYLRSRLLSGSEVRRRQLFELVYGASKVRGCAPGTQVAQWLGEVTEQYIPSPRGPKEDFERQYVDSLMKRLRGQVAREAATLAHQRRSRSGLPCLALVGYTNAGKSRLINALTKKGQLRSEDRLFCTLDTKMNHLRLPNGSKCVLMDSIGFIQGLPLSLCGAFQATLDELHHADILLHVVDVSHPMWQHQRRVVLQALYQNAKTMAAKRGSGEDEAQRRELLRLQLQAPLPAFSRCFLEATGDRNLEGRDGGAETAGAAAGQKSHDTSLLHAVDAEQAFEETKLVERVMGGNTRIIEVWTKIDLVESDARMAAIARLAPLNAVLVSAKDGTGLSLLTQMLQDGIAETRRGRRVRLAKVEFPVEHAQGVFSFITQNCQEAACDASDGGEWTGEEGNAARTSASSSSHTGEAKQLKGSAETASNSASARRMSVHVRAGAEQFRQLLKRFPACSVVLVDEEQAPFAPLWGSEKSP